MDITKRLLGTSALIVPDQIGAVGVDLNGIIRRLILFDTYILKTIRLQEFPFLVAALGFDGTMELLKSRSFEIQCESVALGQTGHVPFLREGQGVLPPLSYCISGLDTADHEKYVHDNLQQLHEIPGLKLKQIIKLKRAIVNRIVRLPQGFAGNISAVATAEVVSKPHLVRKSVTMAARKVLNIDLDGFELAVHAIDSKDVRVETDLPKRLNIDVQTAHKVVEQGLMGVGGLAHRFGEMKAYSAISGFIEEDLPLVYEQMDFLARSISPERKE